METEIIDIIENANRLASIQEQQHQAQLEYEQSITVAENGGIFTLSPLFLTYLYWRIQQSNPTFDPAVGTSLIVIDDYKMPITLANIEQLFLKWSKLHEESLKILHAKIAKIKRARTAKDVVVK